VRKEGYGGERLENCKLWNWKKDSASTGEGASLFQHSKKDDEFWGKEWKRGVKAEKSGRRAQRPSFLQTLWGSYSRESGESYKSRGGEVGERSEEPDFQCSNILSL